MEGSKDEIQTDLKLQLAHLNFWTQEFKSRWKTQGILSCWLH